MAFPTIVKVSVLNSLRRPHFYLTVAIFGALIFLSHFFTLFTLGQPTSMVREVGVSSIFLCGVLASIFLSAQSLASETESGTLAVLLTKPISRTRVLLAKFTGNLLTVYIALAVLTLDFAITLAIDGKAFDAPTAQALVMAFLACTLAAALTLTLATFMPFSPVILASLCLFALGSLSGYLLSLVSGFPALLLAVLYAVVPDYDLLNLTNQLHTGAGLPGAAFAWAATYAVAYTSAALTAACLIFSRREVK
jgi:ABC-type transport system involved in multi-copper enzyme maturation permease subunit